MEKEPDTTPTTPSSEPDLDPAIHRALLTAVNNVVTAKLRKTPQAAAITQEQLEEAVATVLEKRQGTSAAAPKDNPELKGALSRLAEVEKRLADANESKRALELRQRVLANLAAHRIEGTDAEDAADLLLARKMVRWEDDTIAFGKDGVDLETGIAQWAKSESAKRYLPAAIRAGGSGESGRKSSAGASSADRISFGALLADTIRANR